MCVPRCPERPDAVRTRTESWGRATLRTVRALWLIAMLGCQQKPSSEGGGSGSTKNSDVQATTDIPLVVSGKPPRATTATLDGKALARLGKLTFPHFSLELTPYPTSMAIRQRATTRPRMSVNIALGGCSQELPCRPIKLEAWRADEAKLEADVDPALVGRPDSTFEIGETTLGGAPAIFVYQAGQFFGKDERGNPVGSYSHAYTVHYNDGVNFLRVAVAFTDDARDTLADMKRALPRDFLQRVAIAFADAYAQAW